MFASAKALLFGENLDSDPVSRVLGFLLRASSGGTLQARPCLLRCLCPCCSSWPCLWRHPLPPTNTPALRPWGIPSQVDVHSVSQYLTLAFVGGISISSLR